MKTHSFKSLLLWGLMVAGLAGCGGGGGGTGPTPAPTGTATVIKGTASAGIIYPGTVNVYAVSATGAKGALLAGPVATKVDGTYSASLGAYSGAIDVEASGTYTDEATGHTVTIPSTGPLHALVEAVDNGANNNRVVSVTPLTEMAWRKASVNGTQPTTPATMVSANKLVDDLFKISDIVGVQPVRPDNASMANTSQDAQAYTLALAAISQMATTATGATDLDKLEKIIGDMETEVEGAETSGSMSSTMISNFQTAVGSLALSVDFPGARDQLSGAGQKSKILTLSSTGSLPAGTKIYVIQGTLALPVDTANNQLTVSILADSSGRTLSDVFQLAGVAAAAGAPDPVANFMAPQQQLRFSVMLSATGQGMGTGDFATLAYNVVGNALVTAADFSVVPGSLTVTDANGVNIPGISVTLK